MQKAVRIWLFLGLAACPIGSVRAQLTQSSADSAAVIRSTTRLVQLDVVVTDAAGHPVKDLAAPDFSLTEDGKLQKLTLFSVHKTEVRPLTAQAQLPPHVATNHPEFRQPRGVPVVLLLDGINTPVETQLLVRKQMVDFLAEHVDPSMRIAVFAMGNQLSVLQDFTSDPSLLKRAMEQYKAQSASAGRLGGADVQLTVATGDAGPSSAQAGSQRGAGVADGGTDRSLANIAGALARFEKEAAASSLEMRIGRTTESLATIARYLSGFPGRKVVIWFSASFPIHLSIVDAQDQDVYRSFGDSIRRATNLLSDAQVALYTVDARGLTGSSLSDVSQSGRDANGRMQLTVDDHLKANSREAFGRFNEEESLSTLAQETGGRAFLNTNDLTKAIEVGEEDSSSYYVLGYYPLQKKWDGNFRTVKVKVGRSGLSVRHRRGYYAVDPANWRKSAGEDLKNSLARNDLESTSVLFYARALPPAGTNDVKVEFLVDTHTISFETATENQRYCNLEFQVQAFTEEGKLVKAEVQQAEAPLKPETFSRVEKSGLPMPVSIKLGAGNYVLRLGVRDNRTGLFGTADLPLSIAPQTK
jgi:VWFA-related protein